MRFRWPATDIDRVDRLQEAQYVKMIWTHLAAAVIFVLRPIGVLAHQAVNALALFILRLNFVPRPDDIFIVSYPRSGTTWLQMILHQLHSDGSMDFKHISQVIPFFERIVLNGGPDPQTLKSPRIFKSHLPYRGMRSNGPVSVPKGCRYIYIARDGRDVAVSYYHFHTSHLGLREPFERFFERFVRGNVQYGSWFRHVAGWWTHRNDANVLFLTYEELVRDLPAAVRRIADFCGLQISAAEYPRILARCSFGYMKQHEDRFDHLTEVMWAAGYRPNVFLRAGRAGTGRRELTSEQNASFESASRRWLHPAGMPQE